MYTTGGLCVYVGVKCVVVTLFSFHMYFVRCRSSTIPLSLLVNLTLFFRMAFGGFHFHFFLFCCFVLQIVCTRMHLRHKHKDHPFNFLLILQHVVLLQLFINKCTIAQFFSVFVFEFCFFFIHILNRRIITVITNFTFCLRWTFVPIVFGTQMLFIWFFLVLFCIAFMHHSLQLIQILHNCIFIYSLQRFNVVLLKKMKTVLISWWTYHHTQFT